MTGNTRRAHDNSGSRAVFWAFSRLDRGEAEWFVACPGELDHATLRSKTSRRWKPRDDGLYGKPIERNQGQLEMQQHVELGAETQNPKPEQKGLQKRRI